MSRRVVLTRCDGDRRLVRMTDPMASTTTGRYTSRCAAAISSQRLLENARNDSRAMAGQNSDRSLKDSHNTRLFLLNDRR